MSPARARVQRSNHKAKSLFKYGEGRSIVCDFTNEEKINFEGFTQNGCYGNQDTLNESDCFCSFTKQDLTLKQAHLCKLLFRSVQ